MYLPNSTQVPNVLFDSYLRTLKPTELKVLLVVIRQTLGWVENAHTKRRKEKDWISGRQLREKTGYSRRAISASVESLVTRGLVQVLDHSENLLDTPDKRKGKVKLYYRFTTQPVQKSNTSPAEPAQKDTSTCAEIAQEPAQKVRITKPTLTKLTTAKDCERPFTWEAYLEGLHDSDQRHLNVIGFYFEKKGLRFETLEQAVTAVKRHLKPAAQVQHFSDQEIASATNYLLSAFPNFTVETILKHLTR